MASVEVPLWIVVVVLVSPVIVLVLGRWYLRATTSRLRERLDRHNQQVQLSSEQLRTIRGLMVGNSLQRCKIPFSDIAMHATIGTGAWGEVHLATHSDEQKVAVKTIYPHKINNTSIQMLKDEVAILESLKHPNIVNLVGCIYEESMVAMVMEHADHGSMEQWMDLKKPCFWTLGQAHEAMEAAEARASSTEVPSSKGTQHSSPSFTSEVKKHLNESFNQSKGSKEDLLGFCRDSKFIVKIHIIHQVASALSYLHSLSPKVIHRDLKPANILLCTDLSSGEICAKLCDFGTSRYCDDQTMTMTGTPAFIAPEAIRGERYTEAVDVYSFGIVLWCVEMEQSMPYIQELESLAAGGNINQLLNLVAHSGLRPRPPSNGMWDKAIEELFMACLADAPEDRPSASQLTEKLMAASYQISKSGDSAA